MNAGPNEFEAGERVGEFRILGLLGKGGMGSVYLAEDERLRRRVALKVILPELADDPDFRARFESEARSAAAIEHPNVVPIHSAGAAAGHMYLAMRHIDGGDLDQLLKAGPLDAGESIEIFTKVASALDAAHAAGLVHRDVKPANILLEGPTHASVFLTDFGLTRRLGAATTQLTRAGEFIASIDYTAPEQIETAAVDARTDVYALGCVLYRMLSGSLPFPGATITQKMWKIVHEPLPQIPGIDGELNAVIARATAKEPDDRYPSAGDLGRAAQAAADGSKTEVLERSVASGGAATGFFEVPEQDPDQATHSMADEVFVSSEPATERISTPPARGQRSWWRRSGAAIAAAAVVAGGLLVAAVFIAGGSGGSSHTVVEKEIVTTPESITSTGSSSEAQPEKAPTREAPPEQAQTSSIAGLNRSPAMPIPV